MTRTLPAPRCSGIASPGTSSPATAAAVWWRECAACGSACVCADCTWCVAARWHLQKTERDGERVLISLMSSKRRWLLRCLRCWLAACLAESRGQLKATKSATFAYNWKRPTRCCQVPTDWRLPVPHPAALLCTVLGLAVAKGKQRQPATSAANGNYSFKWPINLLSKLFVRQSCSRSRRREMQCPHVLFPLPSSSFPIPLLLWLCFDSLFGSQNNFNLGILFWQTKNEQRQQQRQKTCMPYKANLQRQAACSMQQLPAPSCACGIRLECC